MTVKEAKRLFDASQAEYAECLGKLALMKAEKAKLELRKGDLYRQYTAAQAAEKRRNAETRAQAWQAKRTTVQGPPSTPETLEERERRILDEQNEKNIREWGNQ